MAIVETERAELVQALITTIGPRPAENLMSSILPDGRDHLATKADVEALEATTKAGFVEVHAKVDGGFAKVYGEFAKIDGEFAKVYGEFAKVYGEFAKIDGEFTKVYGVIERVKGEMALMIANSTRTVLLAMLACMVTTWAGMLAGFLMLASMING